MENCIIFDLDGTLVDTAPDLMKAHNYVMKKYGYPEQPASSIRFLAGRGAKQMIIKSVNTHEKNQKPTKNLPRTYQEHTRDLPRTHQESTKKTARNTHNYITKYETHAPKNAQKSTPKSLKMLPE